MTNFTDLGLCEPLLKAVEEQGYEHPMPIQEQVIPHLLQDGGDLIGLAQTGTGKTAAYGLPILQKLHEEQRPSTKGRLPLCLILSPTRELCLQIADDMQSFASHLEAVRILAVYGGANIEPQIRALKGGVDIVVATPGRVLDLMRRGAADLSEVGVLVLDEADEMLSMGFHDELEAILEGLTTEHRSLLFSATMSKEIERIAQRYLHDASTIQVGSRNEGAENVNHVYYMVPAKDKYLALKRVVDYFPKIYAIIFCRTRVETQQVADNLIRDGYNAEALHGDLSQQQRDLTMQRFRGHRTQLLVATDVAARGLDVDDLTHVINFGLPDDDENYIHRSGRTGRAGKTGTSISIVHQREGRKIKQLEREIKKPFERALLPQPREICAKQLYHVIDEIERTEVDEEEIAPFMQEVSTRFEWLDKEDLVKRVLSREFGRFIRYYANAPEIEDVADSSSSRGREASQGKGRKRDGSRQPEPGFARIFLTVSKADGYFAKEIIRLLNEHVRGGKVQLGRIDLLRNFSFIEVPEQDADRVIQGLKGLRIKGRVVDAAIADSQGGSSGPAAKSGRSAWSGGGGDRERRERAFNRDEAAPQLKKNRRERRAEAAGKTARTKKHQAEAPSAGKRFRKDDWMKFLHPDQFTDVDEGSARRHPKKK
ncbi:MAG: DEAD/DEAH box helicase [Prevotellaceae bacterium]|nr:DEAD/DEAH box helicase [Prevotellaceae bacterium]